jgi:hypothetical protein
MFPLFQDCLDSVFNNFTSNLLELEAKFRIAKFPLDPTLTQKPWAFSLLPVKSYRILLNELFHSL